MFTASYLKKASETNSSQRRILIQGPPGSGKTYSVVMSAPNPLIAAWDNGLTNPDIQKLNPPVLPFYDEAWCKEQSFSPGGKKGVNRAVLFEDFLRHEGPKIPEGVALIVDTLSFWSDVAEEYLWSITPISKKTNEKDGYDYWASYADYFNRCLTLMTTFKCDVVITAHEVEIYGKESGRLEKIAPLLKTKELVSRLAGYFTDYVRMHAVQKAQAPGAPSKDLKAETEWLWQIKPAGLVSCKSRSGSDRIYVPARWDSLNYGSETMKEAA